MVTELVGHGDQTRGEISADLPLLRHSPQVLHCPGSALPGSVSLCYSQPPPVFTPKSCYYFEYPLPLKKLPCPVSFLRQVLKELANVVDSPVLTEVWRMLEENLRTEALVNRGRWEQLLLPWVGLPSRPPAADVATLPPLAPGAVCAYL